jgi:hypothetical protein
MLCLATLEQRQLQVEPLATAALSLSLFESVACPRLLVSESTLGYEQSVR